MRIITRKAVPNILYLLIALLSGTLNCKCQDRAKKDTIYYVVFFDFFLKNDHYRWRTSYESLLIDMTAERRDVERQVRKNLSRDHVLLPAKDTCIAKLRLDSISRRNEKTIHERFEYCRLNHALLIIDATWTALDNQSARDQWVRSDRLGTWFTIRSSFYDGNKKERAYFEVGKYAQERVTYPIRHSPGIGHILGVSGHRRFFHRSIRKARKWLATQSR